MMTEHWAGSGKSDLVVDTLRFCCWVLQLCITFGANVLFRCLFQILILSGAVYQILCYSGPLTNSADPLSKIFCTLGPESHT